MPRISSLDWKTVLCSEFLFAYSFQKAELQRGELTDGYQRENVTSCIDGNEDERDASHSSVDINIVVVS